ncbi:MAG: threonylcarbamoyl-AMP synthase [Desulfobacteraceae bacterium]|nr:threonylcarbamoyl-AMP synthase [Desulfobacteraceae bacterium]
MTGNAAIRSVDPRAPAPDLIEQAAALIRGGQAVIYPTRCLYGLGADALNPAAVDRVFRIKQRAADNPVSVLVADREMLKACAAEIPEDAEKIMQSFWPGGITLVFRAGHMLPRALTGATGTIGIRMPAHPVARALAAAVQRPITATSANISGQTGPREIETIPGTVTEAAGLVLDAGELEPGIGSTILDVTCTPPRILREGAVAASDLRSLMMTLAD